jgi:hypothetical protein
MSGFRFSVHTPWFIHQIPESLFFGIRPVVELPISLALGLYIPKFHTPSENAIDISRVQTNRSPPQAAIDGNGKGNGHTKSADC